MITDELEEIFSKNINELGYIGKYGKIAISNRAELCDYQCNDIFKISKEYHENPVEIGEKIVEKIKSLTNYSDYFDNVEFSKPGFINITLSNTFINKHVLNIITKDNLGVEQSKSERIYFLDYGGPNIAKPLHVGHLRAAIIGESLKRIIEFKGYKTVGDVHLGDYGLQIGQVIYGLLDDFKGTASKDIVFDLAYLDELYPRMSKLCKEDEEVLKSAQRITKDLQDGNEDYQILWKKICELSSADIKEIYKFLDVSFTLWNGESDSYPYIPKIIKYLEDKNLIELSEGAKIVQVGEETDAKEMPPFILQKSDGAFLYSTTDLATIYERMEKYNPSHILYVVDARQKLHFEQLFRVCKKSLLVTDTSLEHIGFGTVNGVDGKPFKTRDGGSLKLTDLFLQVREEFINKKESNQEMSFEDVDKIVNAIIKFADLQNSLENNYIFDIKKFSDVIGKTGPYILYTYLRINKILSSENYNINLSNQIYNIHDRNLRLKLLELNSYIDKAFNERKPSFVADYVYELCVTANAFYQNNYIVNLEDNENKSDWLSVLNISNQVIKKMLELLIIEIPTQM
ncbi:MAG: arginine--tRNA ligase [Bacilli bacterium]|nr:arginine--tRNA ligase [Bacilli bacterium]MDD4411216.1 arginine--tRNA ligase [Bacilli bacterium]